MVAYLHPFRLIDGPSSSVWATTIEDANRGSWDYVELHRVVTGLDVGMLPPYHMIVCRDGAMGLPVLPELRDVPAAVEAFNRNFAALLLGGVYCEAITLDGLDFGSVIDWKYLRVSTNAPGAANRFHQLARLRMMPPIEAASLVDPQRLSARKLWDAMARGRQLLDAVPEVNGEFILKGATGIARRDWGAALANLWIVVEQITSSIWNQQILRPAREPGGIPGRADQLSDTRTWTVAARHELLHQVGTVSSDILESLSVARKARNALAHRGKHPTEIDAQAAYRAALSLLKIAANVSRVPLQELDLNDHSISDPFVPRPPIANNPTHWMEIPKLPGEAELEREEARLRLG